MPKKNNSNNNKSNKSSIIFLGLIVLALAVLYSRSLINVAVLDQTQLEDTILKVNITSPLESNGGIPVNLQDQTSPPVLVNLNKITGNTTLNSSFNIGDYIFNVTNSSGVSIGDYCGVFNIDSSRYYVGNVLSVNGPEITMDTPSDFDYSPGDIFSYGTNNMNVDGSTTPIIFGLRADPSLNITVDITRIIIHITDQTAMDNSKFGGIPALTNGVVFRRRDGYYQNLFNVKTNGQFGELAYDTTYDARAPAGFYGFSSRLTFAGANKIGVALRLGPEDDIELLIQDDLTDLDSFKIMAEGHIVVD